MKKFLNAYWSLVKNNMGFYKKHWKGMLVLNVVACILTMGVTFGTLYKDEIKELALNKLGIEKKEEEA